MKLFIDVDNTILEHYSFYSNQTENRTHTTIGKYPEANKQAISTMYESSICRDPEKIKELFFKENVYILTKYPHLDYEKHKRKRLCEILNISVGDLLNLKDEFGINKYICLEDSYSKVQKVRDLFKIETINNCILVDDYSQNIIEWEINGGVGIKYFNEYNSPKHPTNGLAVSNFKLLSYFESNKKIENLFLAANNKYKSKIFLDKLNDKYNINKIDMLKEVYDEIALHLQIKSNMSNNKYNYLNFIVEYYNFRDNIDPTYWPLFFKNKLDEQCFNVYLANFETNLKNHVKSVFDNNNNFVSLKIIDSRKKPVVNVYDVYLTIEDNSFLEDVDSIFERAISFLIKLF